MANERGIQADFVENEVLLFTNDEVAVNNFAARWNGKVISSVDFTKARLNGLPRLYLVSVKSNSADVNSLSKDLRVADEQSRGKVSISSQAGLLTLAVAAHENAHGLKAGLNWVFNSHSLRNGTSFEANAAFEGNTANLNDFAGPDGIIYARNALYWPYLRGRNSVQAIGVSEAWRALDLANKLSNKVDILILDSGFDPTLGKDSSNSPVRWCPKVVERNRSRG
jgi:hypothetical protein